MRLQPSGAFMAQLQFESFSRAGCLPSKTSLVCGYRGINVAYFPNDAVSQIGCFMRPVL